MYQDGSIWVGSGEHPACLLGRMANRHGLIAGATGTGKTISLKVLAEGFSDMGVPVFLADVKGDLAGMVAPGEHSDRLARRLADCGVPEFEYKAYPTVFWDVFGEQGHPVRTTVSEMGPVLLSRMLGLNDVQSGVINVLFRVADDEGMLLLDLKDLKAMLAYLGEHNKDYTLKYGNVSVASVGAIQRAVAVLENEGGEHFFGEPAIDLNDWMQLDPDGRGYINVLAADRLYLKPTLYSTFLLWMLSELYEQLPEVGDLDVPKMVFFFDEAHLLFNNCSKSLMEKVEQVVRLIRSKGVGVYFITQSPADVPMVILGQLGNRIQHALRAYTPLDQKAVKVAAQTFRANPAFSTEEAITNLRTGEALVSFLDADGAPSVVEKCTILPPQSLMGTIDADTRAEIVKASPFAGVYDEVVDRESAYELLNAAYAQQNGTADTAAQTAEPSLNTGLTPEQVKVTTTPAVSYPQAAMTYDSATGEYIPQYTAADAGTQQMLVMVYDPISRQYVQRLMNLRQDPATGNYVPAEQPVPPEQDPNAIAARRRVEEAERKRLLQEAQREERRRQQEAERLARQREAAIRRQEQEQLRRERAAQLRRDNAIHRMTDTALNTASREITRELTRGLLGGLGLGGSRRRR